VAALRYPKTAISQLTDAITDRHLNREWHGK
jgi:hypothetical protein